MDRQEFRPNLHRHQGRTQGLVSDRRVAPPPILRAAPPPTPTWRRGSPHERRTPCCYLPDRRVHRPSRSSAPRVSCSRFLSFVGAKGAELALRLQPPFESPRTRLPQHL